MELATRSQVRVRPLAAAPAPPRPAFPWRAALLSAGRWERGPWPWSCGPGAPRPANPGVGVPPGVRRGCRWCRPGWRGREPPRSGCGLRPGSVPGVAGLNAFRGEGAGAQRSAFAALVEPGLGVGSFSGAHPPLSLGIGPEIRKFKKSVMFTKRQLRVRPVQPG